MKRKNKLILEFTEFNMQRMNPDSAAGSIGGVDDPSLSTNAFDKHADAIRQAMVDYETKNEVDYSHPILDHSLLGHNNPPK